MKRLFTLLLPMVMFTLSSMAQDPMVLVFNPTPSKKTITLPLQGRGNHSLKLTLSGSIDKSKTSSQNKRVSMLSGVIHYRSTKTNEVKT